MEDLDDGTKTDCSGQAEVNRGLYKSTFSTEDKYKKKLDQTKTSQFSTDQIKMPLRLCKLSESVRLDFILCSTENTQMELAEVKSL